MNIQNLRIAAVSLHRGLGGMQNSALSICNGLGELGHSVCLFRLKREVFSHVQPRVEIVGLPTREGPDLLSRIAYRRQLKQFLLKETKSRKLDVLLAFGSGSTALGGFAALKLGLPIVTYVLIPKDYYATKLRIGSLVAHCEETQRYLAEKTNCSCDQIPIVRGRIDVRDLLKQVNDNSVSMYRGNNRDFQIGWMSRMVPEKIGAIHEIIECCSILTKEGLPVRLLLAGDGPEFESVKEEAAKVNHEVGKDIILLLGRVENPGAFLSANDLNIGIGRGAMESIALGMPTCVVGRNGFAAMVTKETIHNLASHNFSGRNFSYDILKSRKLLCDCIRSLFKKEVRLQDLRDASSSYFQANLSYTSGAHAMENLLLGCVHSHTSNSRVKRLYRRLRLNYWNFLMQLRNL